MVVCRDINFKVELIELELKQQTLQIGEYHISAVPVQHKVPCFGYVIEVRRQPKFLPELAKQNNVPQRAWKFLQRGETVVVDEKTYTPDMVLGEERKGFKVGYVTDARPSNDIVKAVKDADLFICEAMYMDDEYLDQVTKYKHMLGTEAAKMAKQANVNELWLTHFSPAVPNCKLDIKPVRNIFENSFLGEDRKVCTLKFLEG